MTTRRQFFGYAGAAAAGAAATGSPVVALDNDNAETPVSRTISPYGDHQAGIARVAPAVAELVSFKLGTDRAGLGRLMRLWTSDLVALVDGRAAPGDTAPELAVANKGVTVTVGFGPRVFELTGQRPPGLDDLPVMKHDRLEPAWSGGDLLVMVGADGAPLTGTAEHDELDLEARDADGRLVIAQNAHARLAHHTENDGRRIFRKGLNYVHDTGATRESGLIFLSHQADVAGQFLPLLARLDAVDALNEWTTTIGSAVFALPPGFQPGGWLGQSLLS